MKGNIIRILYRQVRNTPSATSGDKGMKTKKLLESIKKLLNRLRTNPQPDMQMDSALIREILLMVKNTDDIEITCGEVFKLLDQYIETEQRGEEAAKIWPLVRIHLERCADCREEFEALLRIVRSEST